MSDVIDFLERMGQDAQMRDAPRVEVELAIASAGLDPELQAAILANDRNKLEALLGQHNVCSVMIPGTEEEEEDEGEDEEESPSREGGEVAGRSILQSAALAG